MQVGLIREIKNNENRVALTPDGVRALADAGHRVRVEHGAGINSGFSDDDYAGAGAQITGPDEAWASQLVLKVKEPQESEYRHFAEGQIIFTYFHLSGVDPALTRALLENRVTALAYETVRGPDGRLPLLAPMSAVAGSMSISVANHYLARVNGGRGVLLGRVAGESHGKVVVIGDGVVGRHAAAHATGLGAQTFLFGRHEDRFPSLREAISPDLNCVVSNEENIRAHLRDADAVIGAVLLPGARAPHLVSEEMVSQMQPGAVIVDVSIDQGGCVETSRPTPHSDSVFRVHDVIHYCVTNMPGAYPMTSTRALTSATLPYILRIAEKGLPAAADDAGLAEGVNTFSGAITNRSVAEALDMTDSYRPLADLIIGG
ncbi:MAG: alanine dehydrogenase [Dichotomicrobium sp.]